MQRDVFLAVEATGLDIDTDRVVEIVALEALDSQLTGSQFHVLLDPGQFIENDVEIVTGYDNTQLEGLPTFRDVAPAFLKFIQDAYLTAFNARWSFALIDAELVREDLPPLSQHVRRLQDARSCADQLGLNVRLSLDKLSMLFDCREPVQTCSTTWRDCHMLAQVFPRLVPGHVQAGINIVELESLVPVHAGPYGIQYIEIATIPEPWCSQFIRWLCAGQLNGDERIHRCHRYIWAEWLTRVPAQCPELAPSQLEEFPFVWSDVRDAMRQGCQRSRHHLEGKCVRYRDDLDREIRYQAALAMYGAQEKTLHEAYIRGFRRGLKDDKFESAP